MSKRRATEVSFWQEGDLLNAVINADWVRETSNAMIWRLEKNTQRETNLELITVTHTWTYKSINLVFSARSINKE